MAEFAIEGDAIRCIDADRGGRAPGRIVETAGGVEIADGPSIDGLGLVGMSAASRSDLIEALVSGGHIVHGS